MSVKFFLEEFVEVILGIDGFKVLGPNCFNFSFLRSFGDDYVGGVRDVRSIFLNVVP